MESKGEYMVSYDRATKGYRWCGSASATRDEAFAVARDERAHGGTVRVKRHCTATLPSGRLVGRVAHIDVRRADGSYVWITLVPFVH